MPAREIPQGSSNIDHTKTSTTQKHRLHKNIDCIKSSTTLNIDYTETLTIPKHQQHRNIDRPATSTALQHRPPCNIDHTKTSTSPKHRRNQNIDSTKTWTAPKLHRYLAANSLPVTFKILWNLVTNNWQGLWPQNKVCDI